MTDAAPIAPPATLRPAVDADLGAIATLWHRAWFDGHHGHVPSALLQHRGLDDFRQRAPGRLDSTTIATATVDSGIAGFVVVRGDEIEQLYVDASARGSGVADALLRHGETVIAARHYRAWLAVVAGNLRARRFYERNGWSDTGALDYPARTAAGVTVAVPARRYQKRLTRHVARSAEDEFPAGRPPALPASDDRGPGGADHHEPVHPSGPTHR